MSFINYQDPRPIYEQITDYYEKLIVTGALKKDTQLPSVRQTAAELSVNPNTIQKAFAILEAKGFIYSVKGRGSFIADNRAPVEEKRREWETKYKKILLEGREIGIEVSHCERLIGEVFSATLNQKDMINEAGRGKND